MCFTQVSLIPKHVITECIWIVLFLTRIEKVVIFLLKENPSWYTPHSGNWKGLGIFGVKSTPKPAILNLGLRSWFIFYIYIWPDSCIEIYKCLFVFLFGLWNGMQQSYNRFQEVSFILNVLFTLSKHMLTLNLGRHIIYSMPRLCLTQPMV